MKHEKMPDHASFDVKLPSLGAENIDGARCVRFRIASVHNTIFVELKSIATSSKFDFFQKLTISVLQAVINEYSIPSDFVRKSNASLQIKISTAQLNFSNRDVIIF